MHTFYEAVCDEHKETCGVLVTTTFHVHPTWYDPHEKAICEWLSVHYGCNLRLIKRDDENDFVNENQYRKVSREWR